MIPGRTVGNTRPTILRNDVCEHVQGHVLSLLHLRYLPVAYPVVPLTDQTTHYQGSHRTRLGTETAVVGLWESWGESWRAKGTDTVGQPGLPAVKQVEGDVSYKVAGRRPPTVKVVPPWPSRVSALWP